MASIPILVAHRGYPARYPENTLEGLAAALDAGARCIEFDVQIAADGVPVVVHDDNLRRTAGIERSVLDSSSTDLRATAVGEPARFGTKYAGIRLPALNDAVALLRHRAPELVFVEIKRASLRRFGHEPVVPPILDAVRPLGRTCVIISFDAQAIAMAGQAGFRTGWAFETWNDESREAALRLAPEFLFCKIARLPPAPQALWEGPWAWVAYETDDPAIAQTLAGRGFTYVETDAIGEMLKHREPRREDGDRGR